MGRAPNWKDLTGQRFGSLVVLKYSQARRSHWECLCDCGGRTLAYTGNLNNGHTTTCGCGKRQSRKTHGNARRPLYNLWRNMLDRCANPEHKSYPRYGGCGITVCERWRADFRAFEQDVGARPGLWYSLDRVDNNGNYEPGNVRWATRKEQNNNRRSNRVVVYQGQKYTISQLAEKVAVECGLVPEQFLVAMYRVRARAG